MNIKLSKNAKKPAFALTLVLLIQLNTTPSFAAYPPSIPATGQSAGLPACAVTKPPVSLSTLDFAPVQQINGDGFPALKPIFPNQARIGQLIYQVANSVPAPRVSLKFTGVFSEKPTLAFSTASIQSKPKKQSVSGVANLAVPVENSKSPFFYLAPGKSSAVSGFHYPVFSTVSFYLYSGKKLKRTFLGNAIINCGGACRVKITGPVTAAGTGFVQVLSQDSYGKNSQLLVHARVVSSESLTQLLGGNQSQIAFLG